MILHLISVANVFLSGYPYPGINRSKWIFWIVQYIFKRNYVDIPASNVRYVRAQDFKSNFFPESQYFAKYNGSLTILFTKPWLKLLIPNLVNHWQQCSHLTATAGDRWQSAHSWRQHCWTLKGVSHFATNSVVCLSPGPLMWLLIPRPHLKYMRLNFLLPHPKITCCHRSPRIVEGRY